MVDWSHYIEELLEEHDYVIVPGIGAFISAYRPASFGEGNHFLIPPSRSVSFKPELKINDGLLAGYIARQQKITELQAQKLLDRYVGDILYMLDLGKEVTIGKVGTLSVQNSEIVFHPGALNNEIAGSFGLSAVEIPHDNPAGHVLTTEKSWEEEREKRPFPRKWTGIVLLVAVALTAGYFLLRNDQPVSEHYSPGALKDSSGIRTAVPQNQTDPVRPDTSGMKHGSPDTLAAGTRKGWYYTVGGSFKSQQNASEYFEKMAGKGYHPVHLGKIGDFYVIALDSFSTAKEAYDAAYRYAELTRDTGIWIFHPK